MDSKVIIAIVAVAAVVVIGGCTAVMMNGGNGGGSDPGESWTIEYQGNGGTYSGKTSFTEKNAAISTCKFTREDYAFTEWNTKADGSGTAYSPGAVLNVSTTLYAQWVPVLEVSSMLDNKYERVSYSVSINGGASSSVSPGDMFRLTGDAVFTITGTGSDYVAVYDKDGKGHIVFEYEDYSIVLSFKVDNTSIMLADMTVSGNTASFVISGSTGHYLSGTENAVALLYYPEAGTERVTSGKMSHDTIGLLVGECPFVKEGFKFVSWNTSSDGTGITYNPGDVLEIKNQRLYAQWVDV